MESYLSSMPREFTLELVPMRQLSEVKNFEEDDWTGLSDLQARRKRQNRLSKRAQRRRLAATKLEALDKESSISTISRVNSSNGLSRSRRFWFPLPSDNFLTLAQFDVYRAIWTNLSLICPSTVAELFASETELSTLLNPTNSLPSSIPPALVPTRLQRQRAHPAWIDAVPLAKWRDGMILATESGSYDEEELCIDIMGAMYGNAGGDGEFAGGFVRGEPWSMYGWELSEGFVKKWGFLLEGYPEMVEGTNWWRARRGERPLVVAGKVEEVEETEACASRGGDVM